MKYAQTEMFHYRQRKDSHENNIPVAQIRNKLQLQKIIKHKPSNRQIFIWNQFEKLK